MLDTFWQNTQLVLAYSGIGVLMLLVGVAWYGVVMTRGINVRKELFEDDNPAAGLVVSRFLLAIVVVIVSVLLGDREAEHVAQDIGLTGLYFALSLVLFTVARLLYKVMMRAVFKVDIDDEVFSQNNLAAARVEGAVYLGLGLILAAAVYG